MLSRRDAMIRLGQIGLGGLELPGVTGGAKASANEFRHEPRPTR